MCKRGTTVQANLFKRRSQSLHNCCDQALKKECKQEAHAPRSTLFVRLGRARQYLFNPNNDRWRWTLLVPLERHKTDCLPLSWFWNESYDSVRTTVWTMKMSGGGSTYHLKGARRNVIHLSTFQNDIFSRIDPEIVMSSPIVHHRGVAWVTKHARELQSWERARRVGRFHPLAISLHRYSKLMIAPGTTSSSYIFHSRPPPLSIHMEVVSGSHIESCKQPARVPSVECAYSSQPFSGSIHLYGIENSQSTKPSHGPAHDTPSNPP